MKPLKHIHKTPKEGGAFRSGAKYIYGNVVYDEDCILVHQGKGGLFSK